VLEVCIIEKASTWAPLIFRAKIERGADEGFLTMLSLSDVVNRIKAAVGGTENVELGPNAAAPATADAKNDGKVKDAVEAKEVIEAKDAGERKEDEKSVALPPPTRVEIRRDRFETGALLWKDSVGLLVEKIVGSSDTRRVEISTEQTPLANLASSCLVLCNVVDQHISEAKASRKKPTRADSIVRMKSMAKTINVDRMLRVPHVKGHLTETEIVVYSILGYEAFVGLVNPWRTILISNSFPSVKSNATLDPSAVHEIPLAVYPDDYTKGMHTVVERTVYKMFDVKFVTMKDPAGAVYTVLETEAHRFAGLLERC
jgi:hypothetical protein